MSAAGIAAERQRAAADGRVSVWVAASAGTGKTKVLTDRVLNLMLRGSPPGRILCLTFTKAAASEMANRINRRLGEWTTLGDGALEQELVALTGEMPDAALLEHARRLFAEVLDTPGGMKIATIHAFCQSLLRRFPLEAGIAPHFEVMDERSAAEILVEAREAVLATARSGADEDLAAALAEVSRYLPEEGFHELLAMLTLERARFQRLAASGPDFPVFLKRLHAATGVPHGADAATLLAEACTETAFDGTALRRAAEILITSEAISDRRGGARLDTWLADPDARAAGFLQYAGVYLTEERTIRARLVTKKAATAFPEAVTTLAAEAERVAKTLSQLGACALLHATAAMVRLADTLLAEYEARKALHARLDYDDLILKTSELLRRPGVAAWVLFKLDGGLDHILVDEAQDTNPEQWQVVAALAEEFFSGQGARDVNRTVFAVGDTKQSIYSFQRADPREFLAMREHFHKRAAAAADPPGAWRWRSVELDISFRSTEAVLEAVDAVFAQERARAGVALDGAAIRHAAQRRGHAGRVELWPPVTHDPAEPPLPWQAPVTQHRTREPQARLAAVIAAQIRAWLDNNERLEARGRRIRAGDVMVLVRRRSPFVTALVRALKQRRVPVAGADRMRLTEQLVVEDLVALGQFLLLPEDDLTLATILKSPLFSLDEETLFALAHGRGDKRLWAEVRRRGDMSPAVRRAVDELSALLARADFVAPYELFADVLAARGGRRAIQARLGPEAMDPLDEFLALALAYERSHIASLQGFLHWLATGETEIKRDLDQRGRDEVRIMTVHGAKGLQAPIVILPDTLQAPSQSPRLLWTEDGLPLWVPRRDLDAPAAETARRTAQTRRDEEYRRLLYVAMTRAEDRLIVCGWETRRAAPEDCWYNLVAAGLQSIAAPLACDFRTLAGEDGWTGTGLCLDRAQEAAPRDDNAYPAAAASTTVLPEWARGTPPPEPAPPRPLVPSRPSLVEPATRSPLAAAAGQSNAGFKRGLIVHRLLQILPDLPVAARRAAAERFLARPVHNLSESDRGEITAEILAVLEHPEFAALFGPESQAEVPIVGLIGDYALSGQIDRLRVGEREILIIDYKTLRPPPATEAEVPQIYLRQLAAYRAAVQTIYPGRTVRCALLWTDGPRLMTISSRALDAWQPSTALTSPPP